ncbi:2'-5' RNA ligase family protein [Kribbella italica]|uniref:2'-5' RNA ligase n=1 Tax=Kribbella italica TaxID=1540520 RepID=A0A7W9J173_9ACTN|nr:2'-5' RNA ligase [Kribbella italica]
MEAPPRDPPLVVTLRLDEYSTAIFDELRRQHYPARLNRVGAHLTLFHRLPAERSADILADLCELRPSPFDVAFSHSRFLGRGVAVDVRSPYLDGLHRKLARRWWNWLIPQDQQPFRPHITVQNKVNPAIARQLHIQLNRTQHWPTALATGWSVWNYLGGPWTLFEDIEFGD